MKSKLVVDIGNTRAKLGVFHDNALERVFIHPDVSTLPQIISQENYQGVIFSVVGNLPDQTLAALKSNPNYFFVDQHIRLPFANGYGTPETLGPDRLALVAGGFEIYPNQHVLIIDFGSCITFDFITRENQYIGGSIAPGLQMRLRAMHTFTQKLPLINTNEVPGAEALPFIGTDTRTSLLVGAIKGISAEITQMIRMYTHKFADLQVIMSGGDASFFVNDIQSEKTLIPDLVLFGLNSLLNYNVLPE